MDAGMHTRTATLIALGVLIPAAAAAACSSRRASGGIASRTISPCIGDAKLTWAGPVMRKKSRENRLATMRSTCDKLCLTSAARTGVSTGSPRIAAACGMPRSTVSSSC